MEDTLLSRHTKVTVFAQTDNSIVNLILSNRPILHSWVLHDMDQVSTRRAGLCGVHAFHIRTILQEQQLASMLTEIAPLFRKRIDAFQNGCPFIVDGSLVVMFIPCLPVTFISRLIPLGIVC